MSRANLDLMRQQIAHARQTCRYRAGKNGGNLNADMVWMLSNRLEEAIREIEDHRAREDAIKVGRALAESGAR